MGTYNNISIHAPLTGSDPKNRGQGVETNHFNPRSPYGERRGIAMVLDVTATISIHAPLTGSDIQ